MGSARQCHARFDRNNCTLYNQACPSGTSHHVIASTRNSVCTEMHSHDSPSPTVSKRATRSTRLLHYSVNSTQFYLKTRDARFKTAFLETNTCFATNSIRPIRPTNVRFGFCLCKRPERPVLWLDQQRLKTRRTATTHSHAGPTAACICNSSKNSTHSPFTALCSSPYLHTFHAFLPEKRTYVPEQLSVLVLHGSLCEPSKTLQSGCHSRPLF